MAYTPIPKFFGWDFINAMVNLFTYEEVKKINKNRNNSRSRTTPAPTVTTEIREVYDARRGKVVQLKKVVRKDYL